MLVPSSYWGFVKIYTTDAERVEVGIMMPHDLETMQQQSQESGTQTHHAESGQNALQLQDKNSTQTVDTFIALYTRAVETPPLFAFSKNCYIFLLLLHISLYLYIFKSNLFNVI